MLSCSLFSLSTGGAAAARRLPQLLRGLGGLQAAPASGIGSIGARRMQCSSGRAPRASAAAHPPSSGGGAAPDKKRLAVFVSGGGSNFKAIQAAIQEGGVHGEVAVVVSNAPACGGAEFARAHGIPTLTYPAPKADPAAGLTADELVQRLTQVVGQGQGGRAASRRRRGPSWVLQSQSLHSSPRLLPPSSSPHHSSIHRTIHRITKWTMWF